MTEPTRKRAIVFVDGQNLFHSVKDAFGYTFPNFDIRILATEICAGQGWDLIECRFYTGIPNPADNAFWNSFWAKKQPKWEDPALRSSPAPCAIAIRSFDFPTGQTTAFSPEKKKALTYALRSTFSRGP